MKGFAILYAAMWRIFNNFDVAFRVSIIWLSAVGGVAFLTMLLLGSGRYDGTDAILIWIFIPLLLGVSIVGMSIIAIYWHRFCIFGEEGAGFVFWTERSRLVPYLLAAVKVFVLSIIVGIMVGAVVGLLDAIAGFQAGSGSDIVTSVIGNVVIGAICTGIAVYLPAAAVKRPMTFAVVRQLVFREFWALLVLSLSFNVLSFSLAFIFSLSTLAWFPLGPILGVIALAISVVLVGWFLFMLSIGYISELYRTYFVDGDANEDVAASPQPGQ